MRPSQYLAMTWALTLAFSASTGPAAAQTRAQVPGVSAWVAKAAIIEEHTTDPDLIFALKSGDFDRVTQLGLAGSPFGLIGTSRQRHYVRAHMATIRYLCRDVNALAPYHVFEGSVVRFSGRPDRETGQFRYWIDKGDANADSGVLDALFIYKELGCPALMDYAVNISRYIQWNWK
ncbi:hypothetical protein [Brevundimonas diminuta]|uniref:hypothetical protein n=1 Tax=Brevundimonas diminuta TaxID=293 RepID=UPI003D07CDE4